jgi:hypothetical protein
MYLSDIPAVLVEGYGAFGVDALVVGNAYPMDAMLLVSGLDLGGGIVTVGEAAPSAAMDVEVGPAPQKGFGCKGVVPVFTVKGLRPFKVVYGDEGFGKEEVECQKETQEA